MEKLYADTLYFSLVFTIASTAGISRSFYNGNYGGCWQCVCVGMVSGFFGLGVVAVCWDHVGISDAARAVFYLGLASLIGLAGKEQTEYISMVNRAIFNKVTDIIGIKRESPASKPRRKIDNDKK